MRRLFRSRAADEEIEDELRSHVQHRADDLERDGLSRAEAERRARLEFGGHQRFKEECRETLGFAWLDVLVRDLRYGIRVLLKSPGFTLTAVLTLALGIGANAVVFSVLNAFVLRPLDVPSAETLYQVERGPDKAGVQSYPDYIDLRDRNRSFDGLAAWDVAETALDTAGEPSRVWIYAVSGNYFDVLHLQPQVGRLFHQADEHGPDSMPFMVLGYAYWHAHFHGDPSVVGRVVRVNKHPYTIVGVAPPAFHGTLLFFTPDLYLPLVNQEQWTGQKQLDQRGNHWIFQTIGHLKPGVTPAQALGDLNAIGASLEKAYPRDDGRMTFSLARPGLYGDYLGPVVQGFLAGLMLLAALILLAACANLGSLFAARAADRSREVALRLALGASRARILRQLFTEAVIVSIVGGTFGVVGALALLRALSAWQPFSRIPIHVPVTPDATVYAVALLVSVASGFLFGAVPVRQTLRTDPYEIVKSGPANAIARGLPLRDLLLVLQIAICAVLVTSSIVAVRGLIRSTHARLGFDPAGALLAQTDLSMAGYRGEDAATMQKRMTDTVLMLSGVRAAGVVDQLPLWGGAGTMGIYTDSTTDFRAANAALHPVIFRVSPGYLHAAATTLLAGRGFTEHDDASVSRVSVVNEAFASRIFGSVANAVGSHFRLRDGTRVEIVGVVETGKYESAVEAPKPAMFFPLLQAPSASTWLVVRADRDPLKLASALRTSLRGLDAALPLTVDTWNEQLNSGTAQFGPRMATLSLGVLGAMGALLSVTGIFGLAAYSLSKRRRELGIRMALGAQRAEIVRAAIGRAVKLLAVGSAAGLALGMLASRVLAAMVYQASPRDPVVLVGVVAAMALLGALGTWIPARRALSLNPLLLLHEE